MMTEAHRKEDYILNTRPKYFCNIRVCKSMHIIYSNKSTNQMQLISS